MAKYRLVSVVNHIGTYRYNSTRYPVDWFLLECGHEVQVYNADFRAKKRRCYKCAELEMQPTVTDCAHALLKSRIAYVDIYPCKLPSAIVQIEKWGKLEWALERLRNFGFECTGEQDYMDDLPYSLIQITKLPTKG